MRVENIEELYKKLIRHKINTKSELRQYIQHNFQIPILHCTRCGKTMRKRSRKENTITFRCNYCNTSKNHRIHTSNLSRNIPILDQMYLLVYYIEGLSMLTISKFLGLSLPTVNAVILKLNTMLTNYYTNNSIKIGGQGHVVQIDECFFGKRKYNRGRLPNQQVVFGGIDVDTKQFFIEIIPNRTKETLGNAIQSNILEGTTIHSDKFSSYMSYFRDNMTYMHGWVDHSRNFVDPITGCHTQAIENLWSQIKKFKRKRGYSKSRYLNNYLSEFRLKKSFQEEGEYLIFQCLLSLCFR